MNPSVQQFYTDPVQPLAGQQLEIAFYSLQAKYTKTLAQLNSFKQSSIQSYEKVLQQLQKSKAHHQLFVKKLQKKYENFLHEQRTKSAKNLQKLKSEFQKQRSNLKQIITSKNETIDKLSNLLHKSEQEKSSIVQENTQNLINMVRSEQNCLEAKKYSHTELMKMYQFLLQENNCLKKQLIKVQEGQNKDRSDKKTKRTKNVTQIVYTQQSDHNFSVYVSGQNQNPAIQRDKKKIKATKVQPESINMSVSAIESQYVSKPSSNYKSKSEHNANKKKLNSSYQTKDASQLIQQKSSKAKEGKKAPQIPQNGKNKK